MFKSTFLKVSLYIFYAMILALVLFYYGFPYKKLLAYSLAAYDREIPVTLKIDKVTSETPPVSFSFSDIRVFGKGQYRNILFSEIDTFSVTPSLLKLTSGSLPLALKGRLYEGTFQAHLVGRKPPEPLVFEGAFKSLNLARWDAAKPLWNLKLAGKADLNVSYSGPPAISNQGKGKAALKVLNGSIEGLKQYLIPIDNLDQCTINVAMELSNGIASIKQCKLVCRQGRVDVEGSISVSPILPESRLNLTAKILIGSDTKKKLKLPFKEVKIGIQGSAANPRIKFLGGK